MTIEVTTASTALRRTLLIDAAASGGMGLLLLLAAGPLEPLLGLPASLLRGVALALVPFAVFVGWVATRAQPSRGAVGTIVGANVLWVLASVLVLLSGAVSPTLVGELFVLAQAVVVAGLAYVEYGALRRGRAPARQGVTAAGEGRGR